jgi:hypothetical protein
VPLDAYLSLIALQIVVEEEATLGRTKHRFVSLAFAIEEYAEHHNHKFGEWTDDNKIDLGRTVKYYNQWVTSEKYKGTPQCTAEVVKM